MAWNSLKARVFGVSTAMSVVLLLLSSAYFYWDREQYLDEIKSDLMINAAYELLDAQDEWGQHDGGFEDGPLHWQSEIYKYEHLPDVEGMQEVKAELWRLFHGAGVERVEIKLARIQDLPQSIEWLEEEGEAASFDSLWLLSLVMSDGRVRHIQPYMPEDEPLWDVELLVGLSLFLLLMVGVNMGLALAVSRPLKQFSIAAQQFGKSLDAPLLPENGVTEVATANHAFNRMQRQITDLIQGRTDMLAAISHDIRTPITRLRLRAEMMQNPTLQEKIEQDLNEVTAMLDASLSFLRNDALTEALDTIALGTWLRAYCEDRRDLGEAVYLGQVDDCALAVRPMALKRAMGNIIDNALRYGEQATVEMKAYADRLEITVLDAGAGIPEDQWQAITKPFVRLESSRNRDSGGVGLGLAIVQSIVQLHSGELQFSNTPQGLLVRVILPRDHQ